ncbi:tRNA pseudouridine synthase 1 [Penicillium diatomitis]|uniref:tRNA pseudouridine synthase 1 n=1 Tax=Penicillium diatomitis TaxID=2819901 RepID=A0A9W9X6N1_9EURO|nr:tRNA pseudouridine synthase 1 [Penicillium diatomitis]KAJ5485463.1 tRNA pseudouridine synthase 1 [Penicillium diatomitis]
MSAAATCAVHRAYCVKIGFMRVNSLWQRNIAGRLAFTPAFRLYSVQSQFPSPTRTHSQPQHIESRAETELKEFFKRVPWPTTRQEERTLVASVGTVIWEGQNGARDKRKRAEEREEAKRRKIENGEDVVIPIYATEFSKEDIENEERRPKKKVALMIGYSGTGYYGMQLIEDKPTIEGELFSALVAAGAVSKANATDPKKSSFIRCARTDKGVHAAGNVVSLKMIIEDSDIVEKINSHLSPQIRVWGLEPTAKSFSCYQMCDSRVYEYLLPTHCLLPPHPSTYLGKKIVELAEQAGDLDAVNARQEEVAGYWNQVDEEYIKPILESAPEDIRNIIQQSLFSTDSAPQDLENEDVPQVQTADKPAEEAAQSEGMDAARESKSDEPFVMDPRQKLILDTTKAIKAAYMKARRSYRAPASRIARLQEALDRYVGTPNFYNYTIQKTFKDPSAKRHIKSFNVNPTPVVINGTEWLSLKVHGQSFMMHQIRKMVAMAALVVRCGCHPDRIKDSYGPDRIAIPKAPGLGLLLERPIFDSYNAKAASLGRGPVHFERFTKEMDEFKQREIYDRIFREEEQTAAFGNFFNHIDHFQTNFFLYCTSGGIAAAKLISAPGGTQAAATGGEKAGNDSGRALAQVESEDEGALPTNGEEEG